MLVSDFDSFKSFLDCNWPNKFNDQDIRYWMRELQPWDLERVSEKLIAFKNSHKFAPKAPEIKDACQKQWPVQLQQQAKRGPTFRTVVASQWAASQPQYASDPEPTLVMRYYRYWFCRMRKSITDVADKRKENGSQSLPDDDAMIATYRAKCVRDCLSELLACGLTWEQADAAASWIDSTEPEFNDAIESVRDIIRAGSQQEVPA